MSQAEEPKPTKAARQARQLLEGLAAAGVEFVPKQAGQGQSQEPTLPVDPLPPAGPAEIARAVGRAGPAGSAEAAPAAGLTRATEPLKVTEPPGKSVTVPQSLFVESAEVPETPEGRRQALTLLGEEVARCQKCAELAATRTQTVLGVGPIDPELCLIGEAPGADEDRLGEPFVGQAGQMLNRILDACGLKRDEVYICNILKCRPPGNRTPKAEECNTCRGFLERQLRLVRPKFIVALGAVAAQNLLNDKSGISRLRGRFHEYNGIPVICTYHPAALLPNRSPEKKREVWADMKMLLARMGRPIPRGGSQSG